MLLMVSKPKLLVVIFQHAQDGPLGSTHHAHVIVDNLEVAHEPALVKTLHLASDATDQLPNLLHVMINQSIQQQTTTTCFVPVSSILLGGS